MTEETAAAILAELVRIGDTLERVEVLCSTIRFLGQVCGLGLCFIAGAWSWRLFMLARESNSP